MGYFLLQIQGRLKNLSHLQPQEGVDDPEYPYYIKLKCEKCEECSPKETCVSLSEKVLHRNPKRTVNVMQKCKFCGRIGTILMVPGHGRPMTVDDCGIGKLEGLMIFKFEGFTPHSFSFGYGWKAVSVSGTVYEWIDLSRGKFAEYDEKGKCEVTISELRAEFLNLGSRGKI